MPITSRSWSVLMSLATLAVSTIAGAAAAACCACIAWARAARILAASSSLTISAGLTPKALAMSSMIWSKLTLSRISGLTGARLTAVPTRRSMPLTATARCAWASTLMNSMSRSTPWISGGAGGRMLASMQRSNVMSIRGESSSLWMRSSTGPSMSSFSSWRSATSVAVMRPLAGCDCSIRNRSA